MTPTEKGNCVIHFSRAKKKKKEPISTFCTLNQKLGKCALESKNLTGPRPTFRFASLSLE